MSLVSNYIGGISSLNFGSSETVRQEFDLNDKSFSDILNKQMETSFPKENNNILEKLGIPPGFEILNIDGTEFSETAQDQIETIGEKLNIDNNLNSFNDYYQHENTTTSETVTFFSSLLDNNNGDNLNSQLFDFAKRQATNLYSKGSSSLVMDLKDFITDVLNS